MKDRKKGPLFCWCEVGRKDEGGVFKGKNGQNTVYEKFISVKELAHK